MKFGMLISDCPRDVEPTKQLDGLLRQIEVGQKNGLSYFDIGQHFLYGELRWLQPIPVLARLAAEIDDHVRLGATILLAPLYNPVILAEEIATLDIITRGRLDVGLGLGYRKDEFTLLNVPFKERVSRFDECLEIMKLCWAMEDFDYEGRHWQIQGATPHIQCVQQPHPPPLSSLHGNTPLCRLRCPAQEATRQVSQHQPHQNTRHLSADPQLCAPLPLPMRPSTDSTEAPEAKQKGQDFLAEREGNNAGLHIPDNHPIPIRVPRPHQQ